MEAVTVLAPAKLNLTLGVTGFAENGYHTLDMLMQAVSLYEKVELRKSAELRLSLPGSRVPADSRNTAVKAALAFFHETGLLAGADITVHKRVPVRAGMAGGSADAAAVLVGLNELYGARLSVRQLCAIGMQVGADVPFSILGGTARVTGVGDILTPMPPCPKCWFTVCMPPQGVSTPRAYSRFDELGTDVKVDGGAAAAALRAGDLDALCVQMANELQYSSESSANAPICAALRAAGAKAALMTGSGAAVYGVFDARRRRGRQNGAAAKLAQGVGRAPCALRGACVPRALRAWAACAGAALLFGIIFHTAANTLLRNAKECFLCSQSHTIFTAARGRAAACAPRASRCAWARLHVFCCLSLPRSPRCAPACGQTRCACTFWPIPIRKKTRP